MVSSGVHVHSSYVLLLAFCQHFGLFLHCFKAFSCCFRFYLYRGLSCHHPVPLSHAFSDACLSLWRSFYSREPYDHWGEIQLLQTPMTFTNEGMCKSMVLVIRGDSVLTDPDLHVTATPPNFAEYQIPFFMVIRWT